MDKKKLEELSERVSPAPIIKKSPKVERHKREEGKRGLSSGKNGKKATEV